MNWLLLAKIQANAVTRSKLELKEKYRQVRVE